MWIAGRIVPKRASPRPSSKYIIGIDEAGRGPLAGPVVVAGIRIRRITDRELRANKIKDSKKLTARQREEWFKVLTNHPKIEWAAVKVWPKTIDRINISRSANLGAYRVYRRLLAGTALLDGGLKLPSYIPHEVIIKGDERIPVIAAASIIAKVIRDRTMLRLHKKYPQYGLDKHKGYATGIHRAAVKKFGPSDVHRKSFVKNIQFW